MISTIITAYNKAWSIGYCLKSLLWYNRNYPKKEYEVIVLDDGSQDNTFEIVQGIIKDFLPLNFKYIYRPKKGIVSNQALPLNISFREARGDIINFCMGDVMQLQVTYNLIDFKHSQTYEAYYSYDVYNIGPIGTDFNRVSPHLQTCPILEKETTLKLLREKFGFVHYTSKQQGAMYFFHASIPKSQIMRMGGIDERYVDGFAYEDRDFVLRLERMKYPSFYCDEIISLHLPHPQNESLSNRIPKLNAYLIDRLEPDGIANKGVDWGKNDGEYLIDEVI